MSSWFKRYLYAIIIIFTVACVENNVTLPAMAEGSGGLGDGAFGANRRVRSNPGFVGIDTQFLAPLDFYVPARYDGNEKYIDHSNAQDSKPSFYVGMGIQDANEIDAGIQWEYETTYNPTPGWAAFVSWDQAANKDFDGDGKKDGKKYTNPLVNGHSWRAPTLGFVELKCEVTTTGSVKLTVVTTATMTGSGGQNFSFYWDKTGHNDGTSSGWKIFSPNGNITSTVTNTMFVKRVVAMTQKGGVVLDGSYMSGVYCNTLGIATPNFTDGNLNPQWLLGWPYDDVDSGKTKYDPGDKADGRGKWVIDFDFAGMNVPEIHGPADTNDPTGTYRANDVPARYNSESVSISLRKKPSGLEGLKVGDDYDKLERNKHVYQIYKIFKNLFLPYLFSINYVGFISD